MRIQKISFIVLTIFFTTFVVILRNWGFTKLWLRVRSSTQPTKLLLRVRSSTQPTKLESSHSNIHKTKSVSTTLPPSETYDFNNGWSQPLGNSVQLVNSSTPQVPAIVLSSQMVNKETEELSLPGSKASQPIFFLKTHKTGSSAIQNVILRHALLSNLSVGLSSSSQDWYRFCFEMIFSQRCLCNLHEGPLDILAHHMIFSVTEVKASIKSGSKFVSILRNPIDVITSAFTAFSWDKEFRTLENFLSRTSKSLRLSRIVLPYRYLDNIQSYVFGLRPWEFKRSDRIEQRLQKIAEEFDLILINDERRFNQSLLLLKELMGWTFDDVATLLVNKRMESPNRAVLSEETKKRIVEANHADQLLYERFCQVFDKKVQAFGENKMKEHVERLIRRTEELRNLCIAETPVDDRHVYVYTLTAKGQTIPYCIYMAATEMELTSMLFDRHNDRYGKKRCARRGH